MRERLREGDEFESHYESRVRAPVRQRGKLPPVGVFLADGRWRVAPLESAAERALRAAGALLVAQVRFDGAAVPSASGGGAGAFPPGGFHPWPLGERG